MIRVQTVSGYVYELTEKGEQQMEAGEQWLEVKPRNDPLGGMLEGEEVYLGAIVARRTWTDEEAENAPSLD